MLNLEEALELYKILKPHLPNVKEELDSLSYIKLIVNSMKNENPRDYVDSLMIMYNLEFDDLRKMNSDKILTLFIDGLSENKVVSLCEFIGSFSHARTS